MLLSRTSSQRTWKTSRSLTSASFEGGKCIVVAILSAALSYYFSPYPVLHPPTVRSYSWTPCCGPFNRKWWKPRPYQATGLLTERKKKHKFFIFLCLRMDLSSILCSTLQATRNICGMMWALLRRNRVSFVIGKWWRPSASNWRIRPKPWREM
mgnify:CR=1 FL=1